VSRRRVRYESVEAFYAASRARRSSRKADYGVWWRDGPGPPWWRVTYARDTGELFATHTDGRGPVVVIAVIIAPGPHRPFTENADRLLAGWDDPELTGRRLAWVRNRLKPARGTAATAA